MAVYAVGAWGVGNIGDDAILAGMKRHYGEDLLPAASPGHHKSPLTDPNLLPDILTPEDTLLFGGGGLFYDDASIECFQRAYDGPLRALWIVERDQTVPMSETGERSC